MPMEFNRDFDAYVSSKNGAMGEDVTYTPAGGSASSITVILNQEYIDIDTSGLGVQGYQPTAYVKTADIPNIAVGDAIAIAALKTLDGTVYKPATNYKVVNYENDNTGFTLLILEVQ